MAPSLPISLSPGPNSSPIRLASPLGLVLAFSFSVTLYVLYSLVVAVYQIYFSPLRKIPGPKSWIAFPILRHISAVSGNLDSDCRRFFNLYKTDAIRTGPEEVFFSCAPAWQQIYGHGRTPQLPKPFRLPPGETHSIVNANDIHHTRFRKALAHAFSERALREQESLLQGYTSLLIDRLSEQATDHKVADMTSYYNFATFDIIGDLSFGQPFGCLASDSSHWWVTNVSNLIKSTSVTRAAYQYPLLMKFMRLFQTKALREARAMTRQLARERVTARLNSKSEQGRKDFIDFMEKHKGDADEISVDEMVSNMFLLIIAGSETTATLLAGATYWLLRTPHALKCITKEIRSTFVGEDEITVQAVNTKLPYTIACLQEALRIYPPVPSVLPRMTLQEESISGHVVPKGTHVAVHHTATYWSETNFHRAKEFIPERWLPQSTEDPTSEFYHDNRKAHEPFHVGPRNCLGRNLALAEMRLILTRVLWNFDLELCEGMGDWMDKQKSSTLWLKGPMKVRLKKREVGVEAKGVPR